MGDIVGTLLAGQTLTIFLILIFFFTTIAKHFNKCHGGESAVIQVIEGAKCLKRGGDVFRLISKREVFWIFQIQTRRPMGLNFRV